MMRFVLVLLLAASPLFADSDVEPNKLAKYGPIAPERLQAKTLMDEVRTHIEKQQYAEALAIIEVAQAIELAPDAPEREEIRALARLTQSKLMTDIAAR